MSDLTYAELVEKVAVAIDPWLTEADLVDLSGDRPFVGYSRVDKAARATRRVLEAIFEALKEPTEAQWSGLARKIFLAWDIGAKTPRQLFERLEMLGEEIPQWLRDEPEMQALDHVPSKGTRAVIIFRAMLAASPLFKEGE